MSEYKVITESTCCICGVVQKTASPEFVPKNSRFLCESCFEKVQAEYEKTHPGMHLGTKEDVEQ